MSKTEFSESDLVWMNIYNEGDTLIFQSNNGDLDTSIIVSKEIGYPEPNPVEVHDDYLPHTGIIWYTNKALRYNPEGDQLISLVKKTPKKITLMFNYLYNSAVVDNLNDNTLEGVKDGSIYVLDLGDSGYDKPRVLYWHETRGLVKYITGDNIVWNRIN
ncbi:hypothetical protein [Roseivirga spongicola]|uniref:hypothetical protein n=1 Tax=Roseivirga spongicola TaxID=333140 RepID=UPI002AC8B92E|nr:hypothetical protein [Roseivirga spongicola]WPZ11074.1 hypothetical protein T7867_03045 [Roseivirga spongicola]